MAARFESGSFESYGAVQSSGTDVTVPDANLLFTGDYARSGSDLILTGSDGAKFVVTGYFETDTPPSLISPEGSMLTGDVVTSLAGPQFPGQYAQADGAASQGAKAIGSVQTISGGATVVRANGTTETLNSGDPVFQGDVVSTGPGAKLGIGFVDGTVFSLSANARMVLDSLIYNPGGSDNSMLFSLVEGAFVFTAGQIAPTGNMNIKTPVATMGIRGTTPTVEINSLTGQVKFSLVPDPRDGHEGDYVLKSLINGEIIGSVTGTLSKWELTDANGTVTEIPKTEDDLLSDQNAINDITTVFNTAQSNNQQQGDPNDITNSIPNNPPPSSGLNTTPGNTGTEGNTPPPGNNPLPPPEGDLPPGDTSPPGPTTNNDPPPVTGGGDPGPTGPNIITGTPEIDILDGTEGDDVIDGLASNDTINALGGDDIITISEGDGADIVNGGLGNDRLIISEDSGFVFDGGDGVDVLEIAGDLNIDTRTFISEAENIEIVDLNTSHDNIFTAQVEDFITPGTSNTIQFRGGETIDPDTNIPTGSNDVLHLGTELFDDVTGEQIQGSWQQVQGVFFADGLSFDAYQFKSGETVYATAVVQQGIDVNLVPIADEIGDQSARVNSTFNVAVAAFFVDLDIGDTLEFSATLSNGDPLPQWLTFDTQTGTFSGRPSSGDTDVLEIDVTAIDSYGASVTEDFTLRVGNIGNDRSNFKFGSNGDDVIAGLGGADLIFGRNGDDQLFGDGGLDTIFGGGGKDIIHGGDKSDFLSGDGGNDEIFGDNGKDLIFGGKGNDTIHGGRGNDTLFGDKGNDTIYGDEGNDTIYGGKGNDVLVGGLGNDTLNGGSGEDSYVFTSLYEGVDTIKDFDVQQDVLDLSGLLAGVFDPKGQEPLSDYVQTTTNNGDTTVSVDLDGQGTEHNPVDIAVLQGVDAGSINVIVNDEDTTGAVVV